MSDERPLPTPLPEGARCAIHPDQTAVRTCVRCGNYMCSACTSADTSGLCLTCASRVGGSGGAFPFSRDHFTLDGLLNLSLSRWKANWQLLTFGFGGLMVAVYFVSVGGEFAFDWIADEFGVEGLRSPLHPVRVGFQIAVTLLHFAVQLALFGVCIDLLEGRKFDLERALEHMRRFPEAILQTLVMYGVIAVDFGLHFALFHWLGGFGGGPRPFLISLGVWLVFAPARIYVSLGVMFCQVALLAVPDTNAISAFGVSWRAVQGHRLRALGVSIASAVIWAAGVIACCVGLLATTPIASLLFVALFLALNQREKRAALPHEGFQV